MLQNTKILGILWKIEEKVCWKARFLFPDKQGKRIKKKMSICSQLGTNKAALFPVSAKMLTFSNK